jgi:hypothetical protein
MAAAPSHPLSLVNVPRLRQPRSEVLQFNCSRARLERLLLPLRHPGRRLVRERAPRSRAVEANRDRGVDRRRSSAVSLDG